VVFAGPTKACDPINRETLWYKLQRKGLIIGLMECIKSMNTLNFV